MGTTTLHLGSFQASTPKDPSAQRVYTLGPKHLYVMMLWVFRGLGTYLAAKL